MSYLTDSEYLARYGHAETTRITDEARSGDYDSAKLGSAISDASDIVDAYIGTRYIVPLESPPSIVRNITGALAREILHTSRPLETVTADADRARRQLENISKGTMTLPAPLAGPAAETTGGRNSSSSGDGLTPVFTDDSLSGYAISTGYPGGAWRN
jgi:phage gp36-like protein